MATAIASERREPTFGWQTLLRAAAAVQVVGLAAVAVALGDAESTALAVATILGVVALRFRGGLLGKIILGLLFADVAFFTVAAALANIVDGAGVAAVALPAALGAISVNGAFFAIGAVVRREQMAGVGVVRSVVGAGVAAFAIAIVAAAIVPAPATSVAGALRVEAKNTRYSATALVGGPGTMVVRVANGDLFWHTFTIDELGIDIAVPVGGEREIAFTAKPGSYSYYCRVPGHASAGMRGTLTVR